MIYLDIGKKIVSYKLFRRIGWPRTLPMNVSISLTNRCNSMCKTCNVWKRYKENPESVSEELKTHEWKKILSSLGRAPIWFTFTGGEPFLRNDFLEIFKYACKYNKPSFITIATNGLLTNTIIKNVEKMLQVCDNYNINLIVNLSIDEINSKYDYIRGTKNGFEKVLKTFKKLKELKNKHLTLGVNLVISRYNVNRFYLVYNYITKELKPDSFVAELADNRRAIYIEGKKVEPPTNKSLEILSFLIHSIKPRNKTSRIIARLRKKFYQISKKHIITKEQVIPCYAGIASCEISCRGDVWLCAEKAQSLGNLRKSNYDFKKIWFSKEANKIRENIKKEKCYCNLANVVYTNTLCNLKGIL